MLFGRAARLVRDSYLFNRIRNKIHYPGIGIHPGANLDIHGTLSYRTGTIGIGCNLIIPEHTTLDLGESCYIGRYVELCPGARIVIGDFSSIQDRCIVLGEVSIGKYCLFAPNVYISSGKHHFSQTPWQLIKDQDEVARHAAFSAGPAQRTVVIEDDCWIGINAVIMAGVTIGKGAVIGANAVVTKDVAPYAVVAGAPAMEIKKRMAFVPPTALSFEREADFPYFYSGFKLSQAERGLDASHQGIVADRDFVLYLAADAGNSVSLVAKCIGGSACFLTLGKQRHPIDRQFRLCKFDMPIDGGGILRFSVSGSDAACEVVLQSAWVGVAQKDVDQ